MMYIPNGLKISGYSHKENASRSSISLDGFKITTGH